MRSSDTLLLDQTGKQKKNVGTAPENWGEGWIDTNLSQVRKRERERKKSWRVGEPFEFLDKKTPGFNSSYHLKLNWNGSYKQ